MRAEPFRRYLVTDYVSDWTGRPLGHSAASSAVSCCERVERVLGLDVEPELHGAPSPDQLVTRIENAVERFGIRGDERAVIASIATSVRRYWDFLAWERRRPVGTGTEQPTAARPSSCPSSSSPAPASSSSELAPPASVVCVPAGSAVSASRTFDADTELREALRRHDVHLSVIIAEVGLWASPEVHHRLVQENGTGAWFPAVRRHRPGKGEKRGDVVDGVTLDDNTWANKALKLALGFPPRSFKGWQVCHVWPGTAYDVRYHTAIANLVLIPRAIASLTDYDPEIVLALKHRSWKLYGWLPEGEQPPPQPTTWPERWRAPAPFTEAVEKALQERWKTAGSGTRPVPQAGGIPPQPGARPRPAPAPTAPSTPESTAAGPSERMSVDERTMMIGRIRKWAGKPGTNVNKIIGIVVRSQGGIPREELLKEIGRRTPSRNPGWAVFGLTTPKTEKDYGRVFVDVDGIVKLHPDVADEVLRHRWS